MFVARPEPPQTASADIGEVVAGIVRSMSPLAAHARVKIDRDLPPGLRARIDARRISQAISNVMLNAIQAMPRGGKLRIAGENGASVRLVFRDEGPGFSARALAHYGELFFSEKEGGMGIGLNVASEILKAHGGSLRVANAGDGGAIVSLELPALDEAS